MSKVAEYMTLPSMGLFYGGAIPEGKVEYFPMTAREEKILAGGFKDGNQLIDTIIKACVPTLTIPVEDLLIGDKFFMMLVIRAASYGSKYGMMITCDCGQQFRHEVDLGFTGEDAEEGFDEEFSNVFKIKVPEEGAKEPFLVQLPKSKDMVEFRLLRGKDEKAIAKYAEQNMSKRKSKEDGNPAYIYRIARHIVSVNGDELSTMDTMAFVEDLIGYDSAALRNAIDAVDVGIDTQFTTECPKCDSVIESSLALGPEFFRPKS